MTLTVGQFYGQFNNAFSALPKGRPSDVYIKTTTYSTLRTSVARELIENGNSLGYTAEFEAHLHGYLNNSSRYRRYCILNPAYNDSSADTVLVSIFDPIDDPTITYSTSGEGALYMYIDVIKNHVESVVTENNIYDILDWFTRPSSFMFFNLEYSRTDMYVDPNNIFINNMPTGNLGVVVYGSQYNRRPVLSNSSWERLQSLTNEYQLRNALNFSVNIASFVASSFVYNFYNKNLYTMERDVIDNNYLSTHCLIGARHYGEYIQAINNNIIKEYSGGVVYYRITSMHSSYLSVEEAVESEIRMFYDSGDTEFTTSILLDTYSNPVSEMLDNVDVLGTTIYGTVLILNTSTGYTTSRVINSVRLGDKTNDYYIYQGAAFYENTSKDYDEWVNDSTVIII